MTAISTLISSCRYDLKLPTSDNTRNLELVDYANRAIRSAIFPMLVRARSDLIVQHWTSTETTAYIRKYSLPISFISFRNLWCIEPDDTGTLTGGGTSTVTLATSASTSADHYNGYLLRLTGGTGDNQQTTITDYTSGRVASLSPALSTAATTSSTYAVFDYPRTDVERLRQKSPEYINRNYANTGVPYTYALDGSNLILGPVPDDTYILWGEYYKLPSLLTTSTDTLPYNDLFNDLIRQYMTVMALNRDEYQLGVESALVERISDEVSGILVRRGELNVSPEIRGTEDT